MVMKSEKGFTLIELLVVLVFLGVLVVGGVSVANAGGSLSPDDSVLKAARSMTPNPIVSNGRVAFYGCSNGDTFS
jgi:prepilin-type N-terminal cleavage/methylation domain-containing protein